MPMSWNEQTDAKLLVAVLHTTNAKLDYPALAEYMGPECTEVAVKLRIHRLRKLVNEANDSHGASTGPASEPTSAPASPEKRKKGRKPGSGKAKEARHGVKDSAPSSKKAKKEDVKTEENAEAAMEDA